MKHNLYFFLIVFILLGCYNKSKPLETSFPQSIQALRDSIPINVSRKFHGNILTVNAQGIPPLIISLQKDSQEVFYDFLEKPGKVNIDITSFRKNFGQYQIVVQDLTEKDTSITIKIDRFPPSKRRNKRHKRKYRPYEAIYVKSETIGAITKAIFYCPACEEYITIGTGSRLNRYEYISLEFPNYSNPHMVSCAKNICEMKYNKKYGK